MDLSQQTAHPDFIHYNEQNYRPGGVVGNPGQKRSDIEGLRALAVTFVIIYHLFPLELPGGFIGVDVFFVISGFLIIQHLAREFKTTGQIRVWDFYARRARRLLPASFLVLLASLAITAALAPGNDIGRMAAGIGASSMYVVNWFFAFFSTGYVQSGNSPSIVQQFWSLSVEEQFYLLWPLFIIGVAIVVRLVLRKQKLGERFLLILLSVIALSSLVYSVWSAMQNSEQAFFFTTTRAWEFAAGGLIAIAPPLSTELRHRWQTRLAVLANWGAIIALGWAAVYINDTMPFPGWLALIPVVATAMLIYIGDRDTGWEPARLSRIPPVIGLGGLSYGIYLWHWPLIVGYCWWRGIAPGNNSALAIIIATVLLALATQRFIENPLRFGKALKTTKRAISFAVIGTLIICCAAFAEFSWGKAAQEKRNVPPFANSQEIQSFIQEDITTNSWAGADNRFASRTASSIYGTQGCGIGGSCTFGSPHATKRLVVIGDSFATALSPGIIESFSHQGWKIMILSLGGCPAAFVPPPSPECGSFLEERLAKTASYRPSKIVLINSQGGVNDRYIRAKSKIDEWNLGLTEYVEQAQKIAPVVVLSGSPMSPEGTIGGSCLKKVTPKECGLGIELDWSYLESERTAVVMTGAKYVDTRIWFCDEYLTICPPLISGTYVYASDSDIHISDQYSRRLSKVLYFAINGAESKP